MADPPNLAMPVPVPGPGNDSLQAAFDRLMPLHVLVDAAGMIERCGPTLARLAGPVALAGQPFLLAFDLRRPRDAFCFSTLRRTPGAPLRLSLRQGDHPPMRGLVAPLPDGRSIVNLSFGISLVEAVARYRLTADDFAATDLAVEMLYLVEAQSAALHESRRLNARLEGAKIAAEEQAFTDTLTGLKNRRALGHVAERLLRSGTDFALFLIDLDFFKDVNDTLGHAAGDQVLQAVARVLLSEVRSGDTVIRLGGDEFALILRGMRDPDMALALGRRLVDRIEVPITVGSDRCHVSASIGVVLSADWPGTGLDGLMAAADGVLYSVKGAGRSDARLARPGQEIGAPAGTPADAPPPVVGGAATPRQAGHHRGSGPDPDGDPERDPERDPGFGPEADGGRRRA